MNPLPAKKLIPKTAQETGLSEELVSTIVDFYWKTLHDMMSSLENPNVMVLNLGTFRVKSWKLDGAKLRLSKYIKNEDIPKTFSKMGRYKAITEQIEKIEKLIDYYKKEEERKKQVKAKRYGKLPNPDMEK